MQTDILTKDKSKVYFILEPYVHINTSETEILLFNTLSKQNIEITKEHVLFNILKEIKNSFYVLEIKRDLIKTHDFKSFIKTIYDGFFGYLKVLDSDNKPNQLVPKLLVDLDEAIEKARASNKELEYPMENLFFLSLYLNSYSRSSLPNKHPFFKQFDSPIYPIDKEKKKELDFDLLDVFYRSINKYNLIKIDVFGGNFLEYNQFYPLMQLFNKKHLSYHFHIYAEDLIFSWSNDSKTADKIALIQNLNHQLDLYFSEPNEEKYKQTLKTISSLNIEKKNLKSHFIIKNEEELNAFEAIESKYNLNNFKIHAAYDGNNMDFLRANVFMSKKDILENKNDQIDLLKNDKINLNDFGKLRVLPTGDVYANLNHAVLGNLQSGNLSQLVNKEMLFLNSWFKTRKNADPCMNCAYNSLCPPISNLEYTLKTFNLCFKNTAL
jgi:pseudo-rSAM protein